ncbi:MAG: 50S ribosomal protein L9 [Proteobacteria bacterium]|nr:MAG: 50S ribosomal protein L9 [Pseudomonadota bacterium]PIE17697.1 MAG: 50S ribosomal protein L9 [Pseudomonadota bacterium]
MQVILREDVEHLGNTGDIVNVKPGYGRNYLIPRGLAVAANPKNVARLEHDKRVISARELKLAKNAEALKAKIEGIELTIAKPVGDEDKLFGSVTTRDIAEAAAEKGVALDRKKLDIAEPIRTVGEHSVTVNLGREQSAALKVWVVAK